MFVDEFELIVRGGRGGSGVVSFRREKYVAKGGPDGGDGGDGGSVYLIADPTKHSFLDLRFKRIYRAADGEDGRSKNQHGARGADLLIYLPSGTIVRDQNQSVIVDLIKPGQKALVARGGKGGKGNARFASSRRRVPRLAEKGLPGVDRTLFLELKLMAQVGLVGFPNAGKSTLLSRVTEAKPKVAAYPFTTLTPNLGVVRVGNEGSFVIADLPGLIEGAHEGAGLGHKFLRHVERNLMLLFLIDISPDGHPTPAEAYQMLKKELTVYNVNLENYPRVIVANKNDLSGSEEQLEQFKAVIQDIEGPDSHVFSVSAATGHGLPELINYLYQQVNVLAEAAIDEETAEQTIIPEVFAEKPLQIIKVEDDFVVSGTTVEKIAARTDFENEDALLRFQKFSRRSGLEKALRKEGIKDGDTVRIGNEEFLFYEED